MQILLLKDTYVFNLLKRDIVLEQDILNFSQRKDCNITIADGSPALTFIDLHMKWKPSGNTFIMKRRFFFATIFCQIIFFCAKNIFSSHLATIATGSANPVNKTTLPYHSSVMAILRLSLEDWYIDKQNNTSLPQLSNCFSETIFRRLVYW